MSVWLLEMSVLSGDDVRSGLSGTTLSEVAVASSAADVANMAAGGAQIMAAETSGTSGIPAGIPAGMVVPNTLPPSFSHAQPLPISLLCRSRRPLAGSLLAWVVAATGE